MELEKVLNTLDNGRTITTYQTSYNPITKTTEFFKDSDLSDDLQKMILGEWKFYCKRFRNGKQIEIWKHSGGL